MKKFTHRLLLVAVVVSLMTTGIFSSSSHAQEGYGELEVRDAEAHKIFEERFRAQNQRELNAAQKISSEPLVNARNKGRELVEVLQRNDLATAAEIYEEFVENGYREAVQDSLDYALERATEISRDAEEIWRLWRSEGSDRPEPEEEQLRFEHLMGEETEETLDELRALQEYQKEREEMLKDYRRRLQESNLDIARSVLPSRLTIEDISAFYERLARAEIDARFEAALFDYMLKFVDAVPDEIRRRHASGLQEELAVGQERGSPGEDLMLW